MSYTLLDSSVALKLLVEEPESDAYRELIRENLQAGDLAASALIETELRRSASRLGVEQSSITRLVSGIFILPIDAGVITSAGVIPGQHLRTLDAIHLASALRISATSVVTHDRRMAAAAVDLGLVVQTRLAG